MPNIALSFLPSLQHWQEAGKWLLWGCVFGLAPVWLSCILFPLLGQGDEILSLIDRGQLALYAAAMAGTAGYLASTDRDPPGMKLRSTILLVAFITVVIAVAIYVTTQTVDVLSGPQQSPPNISPAIVVAFSAAVYVASLIVAFLATLIDSERLDNQYQDIQGRHGEDLLEDFARLGK
ncbi:MAG: hypothetical protein F4052_02130 [Dehalococcoidia bacterium]|nr:hypothetical protein [Dehalococcoidia bacterium]MYK25740.1 hypothetical protein [Dehalococcoidia bacterium]